MKKVAVVAEDRPPDWPGRVIAHALWARKRGRQPSMQLWTQTKVYKNPREALQQALARFGLKTLNDAQASGLFQPHLIALDVKGWAREGRRYYLKQGRCVIAYKLGAGAQWGILVSTGYTGWPREYSPYGEFVYMGATLFGLHRILLITISAHA